MLWGKKLLLGLSNNAVQKAKIDFLLPVVLLLTLLNPLFSPPFLWYLCCGGHGGWRRGSDRHCPESPSLKDLSVYLSVPPSKLSSSCLQPVEALASDVGQGQRRSNLRLFANMLEGEWILREPKMNTNQALDCFVHKIKLKQFIATAHLLEKSKSNKRQILFIFQYKSNHYKIVCNKTTLLLNWSQILLLMNLAGVTRCWEIRRKQA